MIKMNDRTDSFAQMVFWAAIWLVLLQYLTGCMQITGAKKITLGTWSIEANNGFEAKAGVQQYDRVDDYRGIGDKK
jgi:hypothetical protein